MLKYTMIFVFLLTLVPAAAAQAPTWAVTPGVSGAPTWTRENAGAASSTHMYVFGGRTGNSGGVPTNALWEFDGQTWTQRTADGAAGSPPARDKAGVCWNFSTNKLVVFGGDGTAGVLGDTWEWDPMTNAWTQIMSSGPSARRFTAIAWDPTSGDIVCFGGLDGTDTHLNDTWILAFGATWVPTTPMNVPSVRRQHSMVSRPDFGDVLMCCGQDATLTAPAKWRTDVWTWNGSDWTLIPTTNTPEAVVANQAVYDTVRRQVVVTGGNGISGGSPTSAISEFDTVLNDWVVHAQATPSTPAPTIGRISRYFAAFLPTTGYIYKINGQVTSGASVSTTCEYGFGLPPIFPGNGTDAAMSVSVNGSANSGFQGVHSVAGGDLVAIQYDSPGGTLIGASILSFLQLYPTGSAPAPIAPVGLYFDPALITLLIMDGFTNPAAVLSPVLGGNVVVGSVPVILAGTFTSFLVNLLVVDPASPFAVGIADAREFEIQ